MSNIHSKKVLYTLAAASVFLSIGCMKAPIDKVNQVKALLDSTNAQKAQIYAIIPFHAAQDSLKAAMTEINKIGPSSFTGAYAKAESLLTAAQRLAEMAHDSALLNMQKAKTESDTLIAQATASLDSIGVKIISKTKKNSAIIDSLKIGLDSLKTQLNQALQANTGADYFSSKLAAKSVLAKADSFFKIVDAIVPVTKSKK